MQFSVRRYDGADRASSGYVTVEAGSAKEAAERVCGEALTENGGKPGKLRATVHTKPPTSLHCLWSHLEDNITKLF